MAQLAVLVTRRELVGTEPTMAMLEPRFPNGDEAGDLCLIEGSDLVLLEVKASILTARAKYGFSAETLLSEVQKKAITGVAGERKGVAQLSHNIRRFLEGEEIIGVDRARIRTIYPALVFLDHSRTAPYLNLVYNEHFGSADLRRQFRRRITPVFSLTIEDLEKRASTYGPAPVY